MREGAQEAHYQAEAVEEWWGAADDVVGCELHSVGNEAAVIDQVAVFFLKKLAVSRGTILPGVFWTYMCVSIAALGSPVVPIQP